MYESAPLGGYTVPRIVSKRLRTAEAPSGELFDLDTLRTHLRFPNPKENDYLKSFILPTAIDAVERYTSRFLLSRKLSMTMDFIPGFGDATAGRYGTGYYPVTFTQRGTFRWFDLMGAPVLTVQSMKYIQDDGVESTFPADQYLVDAADPDRAARIILQRGALWPSDLQVAKGISIAYTAGYGEAADVPASLKHAVLLIATALFTNRGDSADSQDLVLHFPQVRALLAPYIIPNFITV
jgi:hypothetical protein